MNQILEASKVKLQHCTMFDVKRKNNVDRNKLQTDGEEGSSLSFGTGSCLHEIDNPT